MRKQNAIYWPPATADSFGRRGFGALVELVNVGGNYRVRWEDSTKEYITPDGTAKVSNALVYVPRLPDGSEITIGGYLWLGDRADLTSESDPRANDGAFEVQRFDKLPDLKSKEFLRTCYV